MRWKWILGIVAALIVAAVVGAYLYVASYDFDRLKPEITEAVKRATGRELTIERPISVKIGLLPVIAVEGIRFQNAPWGSTPDMLSVKRCEIQIALLPLLKGVVELKRFLLIEPQLHIEKGPSGRSNLDFRPEAGRSSAPEGYATQPAPREARMPAFAFGDVQVRDAVVTFPGARSGEVRTLRLDRFGLGTEGLNTAIKVEMKGSYDERSFEAKGETGSLAAFMSPQQPWDVKVRGTAAGVDFTLDGSVQDVLQGRGFHFGVTAQGASLGMFSGAEGARVAGWPGPFKSSFEIGDSGKKHYQISNLKIDCGGSDLEANLEVDAAAPSPAIKGTLSSRRLDLRPYLPERGPQGKNAAVPLRPGGPVGGEKIFSSEPLSVGAPGAVDLDLDLAFKKVFVQRLDLDDVKAKILLSKGALKVETFQAAAGKGTINGSLDLKPQKRGVDMGFRCKIVKLDVGQMTAGLDVRKGLEGQLDADLDLRGTGASVAAIMAGLSGKVVLVMGAGSIQSGGADFPGADVVEGVLQSLGFSKERKDFTDFNCMVVGFDVTDGLARSTGLVLDSNLATVVGTGHVNLKNETLDIAISPYPKEGVRLGAFGKVGLNIGKLSKVFRLSGTLKRPRIRFDPEATALMAGEAFGGSVLFGPAGIAAALATGVSGSDNPCLAAIKAAQEGVRVEGTEGSRDAVEKAVGKARDFIDRLLNK